MKLSRIVLGLKHNGPAIKVVSVAERLKAGKQRPGRNDNAVRPE
jgi:hypothetical protein